MPVADGEFTSFNLTGRYNGTKRNQSNFDDRKLPAFHIASITRFSLLKNCTLHGNSFCQLASVIMIIQTERTRIQSLRTSISSEFKQNDSFALFLRAIILLSSYLHRND